MTDSAPDPKVVDDPVHHRFVLELEGSSGELVYELRGDRLFLIHTEIPESLQGHGLGGKLVRAGLDRAEGERLTIVPWCPYARHWLREHPDDANRATIDWHTSSPGSDEET